MKFIPHNALEEQLAAVHAGTLDPETFVLQLVDQQLFMPVRDEKNPIQGFQRSVQAEPLIIETDDGERVLVVFTSPERAKPFVEHYPEFSGGLLTEFSWLLRRIGGGVPIALNPGWDIGMDFDADMIAQLGRAPSPRTSGLTRPAHPRTHAVRIRIAAFRSALGRSASSAMPSRVPCMPR